MGNAMKKPSNILQQKPNQEGPQPQSSTVRDAPKAAQKTQVHNPGDGIRSMKTSGVFRALNFELYAKPNKPTMIIGGLAITICAGYIVYMNLSYDRGAFYPAENADGTLILRPKKSRWDS